MRSSSSLRAAPGFRSRRSPATIPGASMSIQSASEFEAVINHVVVRAEKILVERGAVLAVETADMAAAVLPTYCEM